jgi:glutaconate CoA-transferase, subunit A
MRAASFGIPFQPIPPAALAGSDIPERAGMRRVRDPFSGEDLWVVPAITPDWLLMHAQYADELGNVRLLGNPSYDGLMSRAARDIIVTAEEILPTVEFEAEPERTLIPHFMVRAVVHAPRGAWPAGCLPLYDVDDEAMRHYLELSVTPEGLQRYLGETADADRAGAPAGSRR